MSRLERKARHRPNNSGSSISSSEGGSLEGHAHFNEERAASGSSRRMVRNDSEMSQPYSPLSARLPLPTDRGFFENAPPMTRFDSHDGYRMPWSRKADDDGDNDPDEDFGCSLAHEFDRIRRETDDYAATDSSLTIPKRQMWLDAMFDRISMMYRTQAPGKQGNGDSPGKSKTAKPHFLDLSSIISPVPLDITTPPASQLNREVGMDTATPKPASLHRFASDAAPMGDDARRCGRPALQPSFAANVVPVGSATSGPTNRSLRIKASQESLRSLAASPTSAHFSRPGLRPRRSFENPSEVRRRQKDEWAAPNELGIEAAGVPQLPDWARNQNRANYVAANHAKKPSDPFFEGQSSLSAVPSALRSSPMSRGVSHDTGINNPPTPTRPRLGSRASSSALRHRMDRSTAAYPSADIYSPISPSFPPAPPLTSSRGSIGSSTGSDSMPQTPNSATFIRPLANITPPKNMAMQAGHEASPGEKEYIKSMVSHHARAQSHVRSPSTSSSEDAHNHAWSPSRSHVNATPRATKLSRRPPMAHHGSYAPDDHPMLSPPRSSSLRRNLSEAGEMLGGTQRATSPPTVMSSLPYTQDEPRTRKQQHASWGSESQYSNDDEDAGSAYVSAIEHQPAHGQAQPQRPTTPSRMQDSADAALASKWSPPTPVMPATIQGRNRANSRAEEWASSLGRRFAKGVNAKMA